MKIAKFAISRIQNNWNVISSITHPLCVYHQVQKISQLGILSYRTQVNMTNSLSNNTGE